MGQPQFNCSLEDYLAIEREDGERYEFHDGVLYAMAGGTYNHSLICSNVAGELRSLVKGGNCTAFNSEMKVEVKAYRRYVYPDASVAGGKPKLSDLINGCITNPTLIVEVVSRESGAYDRGQKFRLYFALPSVREYLLVEQDEPSVTLFRRHGDTQLFATDYADGLEERIELKSIGAQLTLAEIYADVIFPAEQDRPER